MMKSSPLTVQINLINVTVMKTFLLQIFHSLFQKIEKECCDITSKKHVENYQFTKGWILYIGSNGNDIKETPISINTKIDHNTT